MKLRVPRKVGVRLVPSLRDEVLFAWLQYFYLLLPVGVLVGAFVDHMYKYRVVG